MGWRRVHFTLKLQLTAAGNGAVLKFDSKDMISSGRSWQNLVGFTERGRAHSQLMEVGKRERERERRENVNE